MRQTPFARVVAAVATPFAADDSIDLARLLAHCRWLLAEGCDGLLLFGSTGEATSLTIEERRHALLHLIEHDIAAARLLIGTGCCALDDTVALSRHAIRHGCAGVLVLPPFFFKNLEQDGILRYFHQLIDRVADPGLALYLYHFPQASMVPISVAVTRDLAHRFPGVVKGYKDRAGDWTHTETLLAEFPDLEIYSSTEARLGDVLRLGGAGCVSATANVQPRAIRQLVEAVGKPDQADLQRRVAACRTAFQGLPVVPAVKAALARLHDDPAWLHLRAPLSPLDPDRQAHLLAAIGL